MSDEPFALADLLSCSGKQTQAKIKHILFLGQQEQTKPVSVIWSHLIHLFIIRISESKAVTTLSYFNGTCDVFHKDYITKERKQNDTTVTKIGKLMHKIIATEIIEKFETSIWNYIFIRKNKNRSLQKYENCSKKYK